MRKLIKIFFSIPFTLFMIIVIIIGANVSLNDQYYWYGVAFLLPYGFFIGTIKKYLLRKF